MGNVTRITEAGGLKLAAPCRISVGHDTSRFDCGKLDLDNWLRTKALKSDGQTARTYVVCAGDRVVGFYSLATGAVFRKDLASAKLRRNTPSQIPVIVIGRLAVDKQFQGQDIGSGMLKDAIYRSIGASRTIGVKAIVVHVIDNSAVPFYLNFDFIPSPTDALTLVLPIATAIAAIQQK